MADRSPLWREADTAAAWVALARQCRRWWVPKSRQDALRRHRAEMTMECTNALCEVLDKYGVVWEVFLRSLPPTRSPHQLFARSRRARLHPVQ